MKAYLNNEDLLESKIERLEEENAALRADKERLLKIVADLAALSSLSMRDANRDGADYDIKSELAEARAALDAAKKEQS